MGVLPKLITARQQETLMIVIRYILKETILNLPEKK